MLVAFRELGAAYAVSPYLLGQAGLVYVTERELPEKIRPVRQGKDPCYPEPLCLDNAVPYELFADAFALIFLCDGERPHLGKVFPKDVQGAYAYDFIALLGHEEVPDILIQFINGAGYHLFPAGKLVDELLDRFNVPYDCFSDFQYSEFLPVWS